MTKHIKYVPAVLFILFSCIATSCTRKEEKIAYGKDNCAECRMTIVDPKFGAEIITKRGKIYKFDDAHCIAQFLKKRTVDLGNIHKTLVVNYSNSNEFIKINDAQFLVSSLFKSPMGGNAAAFKTQDEADRKGLELEGSRITNWATLYNILVK